MDKWKIGKRLLITEKWGTYPKEVTVIEISQSKKFVKLKWVSGNELWEESEDYNILEELPPLNSEFTLTLS